MAYKFKSEKELQREDARAQADLIIRRVTARAFNTVRDRVERRWEECLLKRKQFTLTERDVEQWIAEALNNKLGIVEATAQKCLPE